MSLPKLPRLPAELYMFLIIFNAIGFIGVPMKIFYHHEAVEQWSLFMWLVNALFEVYWIKCWRERK